ncbi:hypothetical protein [Microseira wollei]|uniref:Uncharacterized protein n=1 Tax=Microseira wollei NIES-4236 TaxID=2530354 RepID=A0AAV3XNK6_9CYAN|nr:hypothetical protein [Microseira wollei]GET43908.1 hypothetical protein MiSe_87340 [Microseira wollei NIES-4236]
MLPETLREKLPYFAMQGGIAVCRQLQTEFGTWCPAIVLPYYWKANVLKVICCLPEHGFDKACPIDAPRRWPNYTDFFIMRGVMLYAYAKVDGYLPIYLGDLTGEEANLISLAEFDQTRMPINSDRESDEVIR